MKVFFKIYVMTTLQKGMKWQRLQMKLQHITCTCPNTKITSDMPWTQRAPLQEMAVGFECTKLSACLCCLDTFCRLYRRNNAINERFCSLAKLIRKFLNPLKYGKVIPLTFLSCWGDHTFPKASFLWGRCPSPSLFAALSSLIHYRVGYAFLSDGFTGENSLVPYRYQTCWFRCQCFNHMAVHSPFKAVWCLATCALWVFIHAMFEGSVTY